MRRLTARIFLVSLFWVLLASAVFGQGFPWEIFKSRSLKEVTQLTKKQFKPDDTGYFATNLLETKAEVTFTGKSRPISSSSKTFLGMWAGLFGQPKSYAVNYEREFLYLEGSDEYWLPTAEPITKYFDKELKAGDKMMLYLISIGAHGVGKDVDCVLLVEEYQAIPPPKAT